MMTAWAGGRVVARELPLASPMTFTGSLRGRGTFDAVIEPHPAFSTPMQVDYWARVLWPCKDGQPYGCYAFTKHGRSSRAPGQVTIHGDSADGMLQRRLIRHDMQFSQVDQNDIVRDLIRYGTGQSTLFTLGGSVTPHYPQYSTVAWWTVTPGLSGVKRDRLITPGNQTDGYVAESRKVVGDEITNLLELGGEPGSASLPGPELRLMPYLDSATGDPRLQLDLGYPRVGNQDPTRILFDYPGGNVASFDMAGDGTGLATYTEVGGQQTDGTARPFGTAVDGNLLAAGVPYLARFWSDTGTAGQGTLDSKAAARLGGGAVGWSAELDGTRSPRFGLNYTVGDYGTFRITEGGVRWADQALRITDWKMVAAGLQETVSVGLAAA